MSYTIGALNNSGQKTEVYGSTCPQKGKGENEHDCERIVASCSYGNRFGVVRWDHSAVATSLASH